MAVITERKIREARPGDKLIERAPRGSGRLMLKVSTAGGKSFYWRTRVNGVDALRRLGDYPAISLAEARELALQKARDPARAVAARGTLGDVLDAYVSYLEDAGKASAADVRRGLLRALPEGDGLRRRRASEVSAADITGVVARRVQAGATVEANRLRAHLHAAFAHAAKLDHDPRAAAAGGPRFGITANPVTLVRRIAEFERTRDRTLSWDELGAYWRALANEPAAIGATLRFILAVGQQRIQQVLRCGWDDIAEERLPGNRKSIRVLRITDTKGRGGAREHLVPLTPLAEEQLTLLSTSAKRRGASQGERPPRPFMHDQFVLSAAIARASAALPGEPFDARDLRRSVETRLGDLRVGRETLAHLLSHGRSGVQSKHYDRAARLPEKLDALELWEQHLRSAIRGRKASSRKKKRRTRT